MSKTAEIAKQAQAHVQKHHAGKGVMGSEPPKAGPKVNSGAVAAAQLASKGRR